MARVRYRTDLHMDAPREWGTCTRPFESRSHALYSPIRPPVPRHKNDCPFSYVITSTSSLVFDIMLSAMYMKVPWNEDTPWEAFIQS